MPTMILIVTNREKPDSVFIALKEWGYKIRVIQALAKSKEELNEAEFDMAFIEIGPDSDSPFEFQRIKILFPCLAIIGMTTLPKSELDMYLKARGVSHSDFANIIQLPLPLERLMFVIEEVIVRNDESPVARKKSLSRKEIQHRLNSRRGKLEKERLSVFLKGIADGIF